VVRVLEMPYSDSCHLGWRCCHTSCCAQTVVADKVSCCCCLLLLLLLCHRRYGGATNEARLCYVSERTKNMSMIW
jgi:hypothetical protein